MGWMQELYKTYEKSRSMIGIEDSRRCVLLPIAHSTQNAQIEIAINLKGDFKGARTVEKANAVTIIPVTEDSGSRSSGIAPHPLCDKLCYIAGDYARYYNKKNADEYFRAYIEQLEQWVQYGCHDYVKAVYSYIKKGTVIRDLVDSEILTLNENGMLEENRKIEVISQADAFVRFRIQDESVPGLGQIWTQQEVYEDFIQFYLSRLGEPKLDYVTGEFLPCSEKQPSKIRNSADKAKLISANDNSGFTYRGRFANREEAISIGYVPSQEAHNALKWLIERQAYRRFGMCVVSWNPEDRELPDWMSCDTNDLTYGSELTVLSDSNPDALESDSKLLKGLDFNAVDIAYNGMAIQELDLGEHYADQLRNAILGRYAIFQNPGEEIVVMMLDAATPGRLSVTYYQQMLGSDFLDRLIHWHTTATWKLGYKKGVKYRPMAPEPADIVRAAFGIERGGLIHVDDPLMKATLERLVPCIIEGKRLPPDIVRAAVASASRPMAFGSYNRRKILEITCALIHKKYKDMGREEFDTMSLDRSRDHRDYLYGRLLAIAHKLEYDTFSEEERGKRETNAVRFTDMLVKNPTKIWPEIDRRLSPYRKKLNNGLQVKYQREFQEVYNLFKPEDFSNTERLGEQYLLGYNCELSALWSTGNPESQA